MRSHVGQPAKIRPPAVAGKFYPADRETLRAEVDALLAAEPAGADGSTLRGLVAPHAGYVYSGPVAASAFRLLPPIAARFRRVVLLGPSHQVAFAGIALSSASHFATPLGNVPLDEGAAATIADQPWVFVLDRAHAAEHALEVELPFLQRTLGDFALVPLVVGEAAAAEVAATIEALASDPATLVVVSTDLSHYLDYESARRADRATSQAILARDGAALGERDACGVRPLRGLLAWARERDLAVSRLDLRNSGDTAGGRDRVVGYGAYAVG
ncbi:MAG: AmmeMemoRadiSam system protein B [Thermoanaerobaculia bacterium]